MNQAPDAPPVASVGGYRDSSSSDDMNYDPLKSTRCPQPSYIA